MKAVFTVLTGNYDQFREPIATSEGFDYFLFTDNPNIRSKAYTVILLDNPLKLSAKKLSREVKLRPHLHLKHYKTTVYHDANLVQRLDIIAPDAPITVMKHPTRNCIYKEGKQVKLKKLDSEEVVNNQLIKYWEYGYPENNGLGACGYIVRQNTDEMKVLSNLWWEQVRSGSYRDQLSFNFIFRNVKVNYLPYNEIINNRFLKYGHNLK